MPKLARGAAGVQALSDASRDDARLRAAAPHEALAGLAARRALRAAYVGDFDAAARAADEAIAAPPSSAPTPGELRLLAAEIAARRGDDLRAAREIAAAFDELSVVESNRACDIAAQIWVRSAIVPESSGRGSALGTALDVLQEVARGRLNDAKRIASGAKGDPSACAIAGAAIEAPLCPPQERGIEGRMDAAIASGRLELENRRLGNASGDERVLASIARACALRDPGVTGGVYASAGSGADDDVGRCLRAATSRDLPGRSFRVELAVERPPP